MNLGARIDSSLNVDSNNNFSRPPSSVQIGFDYSQVNQIGGPIILSNDSYVKLKSFVNSQNITTVNEEFIFQYGFSSKLSFPLIKKDKNKTQILSPRLAISFNEQENKIAGEYFIGSDELSFGNIYSSNKIASLSENEKKISFSAGIDYRATYKNADKVYFGIGLSKISGTTYQPNYQNGLNNKKPNYVTEASLKKQNGLKLFGNALISDSGKILNGNLKANHTVKNLSLGSHYEFLDHSADQRLTQNLHNFTFSSGFNLKNKFQFSTAGRYDIVENSLASTSYGFDLSFGAWNYKVLQNFTKQNDEKFTLSAIYEDKCTSFAILFENRQQQSGSLEPITTIGFSCPIKAVANVAVTQRLDDKNSSNSTF